MVQTGSEGMAKVVFNDGTNYTVKQDSLIVIEENSAPLADIVTKYRDFLEPRSGTKTLDDTRFLINGLPVYHFVVRAATTVNYKILGEAPTGKRFLIEYVISAESFGKMEQPAESSIAALKPTPGK